MKINKTGSKIKIKTTKSEWLDIGVGMGWITASKAKLLKAFNSTTAVDNPALAYDYATTVIKGRFPDGEAAISRSAKYSYLYAMNIIKGRWPEGEAAISKDKHFYILYTKMIRGFK